MLLSWRIPVGRSRANVAGQVLGPEPLTLQHQRIDFLISSGAPDAAAARLTWAFFRYPSVGCRQLAKTSRSNTGCSQKQHGRSDCRNGSGWQGVQPAGAGAVGACSATAVSSAQHDDRSGKYRRSGPNSSAVNGDERIRKIGWRAHRSRPRSAHRADASLADR